MIATGIAIVAIIVAAIPTFFMARSDARERKKAKAQAIAEALTPLQDEITELKQKLRDRNLRIEQLEDERAGGKG